MIANHPTISCFFLIAVAVFSHFKKEKHSPIYHQLSASWETGWFKLREDADRDDLAMYQIFFALKWLAIGALLAILVIL
jgi:hypothetical protein